MSQNTLSRRNFMTGMAVGGTAATLASPAAAVAAEPVVAAIYPLAMPAASAGSIKMLCTHKVSAAEEQQIRSAGKNVDFVVVGSRAELKSKIAEAEAIFGPVDADSLAAAKNLKWIQHTAAGVEVLPKELMEHSCVLTNMQRVYAPVIAESALGMALSLTRGLVQDAFPNFKARKWGPRAAFRWLICIARRLAWLAWAASARKSPAGHTMASR